MKKLRIAVDMDNTSVDLLQRFCDKVSERKERILSPEDCTSYSLPSVLLDKGFTRNQAWACKFVSDLFNDRMFYALAAPIAGCLEALSNLHKQGWEIVFASKCTDFPESLAAKVKWVERHAPFAEVMLCSDKSAIGCDVAVDDLAEDLLSYNAKHRFLFMRPYNQDQMASQEWFAVYNWDTVQKACEVIAQDAKESWKSGAEALGYM